MLRIRTTYLYLISISLYLLFLLGCSPKSKKDVAVAVAMPTELTAADIGNVYTIKNAPSQPNFGQYLILVSTNSRITYTFNSFDLVDNEPIGKLLVSYAKDLEYKKVDMNPELIQKAKEACARRMKEESNDLNQMLSSKTNQSEYLKKLYGIPASFALNRYGKVQNSTLYYGLWIDPDQEEFNIHLYEKSAIIRKEKLKWSADPMWQIAPEDQQKIVGILDQFMAEIENK